MKQQAELQQLVLLFAAAKKNRSAERFTCSCITAVHLQKCVACCSLYTADFEAISVHWCTVNVDCVGVNKMSTKPSKF